MGKISKYEAMEEATEWKPRFSCASYHNTLRMATSQEIPKTLTLDLLRNRPASQKKKQRKSLQRLLCVLMRFDEQHRKLRNVSKI
uniref:Uncharacterized protein n=1 Tax=Setaria digitata TaxID=48799 RepID=A0A915PMV3_9BILA